MSDGSMIDTRVVDDMTLLDIENIHARAVVSLGGGQVLSFQPHNEEKVLWMSPKAIYKKGAALRGGIPVCWPWFGPGVKGAPQHGFARNRVWQINAQEVLDNGETRLLLSPGHCSHHKWDGQANLQTEIIIGRSLKISLITHNTGNKNLAISQALHSYFTVSDLAKISVEGLDGIEYLDVSNGNQLCTQCGDMTYPEEAELNRIYRDSLKTCIIHDFGFNRSIIVRKSGSNGTVAWNPGKVMAKGMSDVPDEAYHHFACIETATRPDLPEVLAPGKTHQLSVEISVER